MAMLGVTSPRITPEILSFVAEVDEFKGRWQALQNLAPERAALHALTPLARSIAEVLAREARVSVAEIVRLTGANRNTVKATLLKLRRQGLVAQHGKGRGVFYTRL